MTDAQLDALLEIFQERMQRVTDEYLTAMGEQIKEIGRVIPSAETRLIQMRRMRMNVRKIQNKIAAASGEAVEDIVRVFEAIAADNARFAEAFSDNPDIAFLSQSLLAQIKATAGEMANLSRTTIDSTLYRDVIDRGIQAAQADIEDYNSAIRRALREASAEGIRVTYPSGHTRRLDTAMRQNVLDGIRKLNQANMEAIGEKFGADGVEISAHMMCAEDHLPYQGKQYSNEEFARIQAALKRPFGEWNCRHSWSPIILGISRPAYTDAELRQFEQNSTEKITIDGKTKTRYEWTQEQRKVETSIRYQQDIATAAKASGDTELRREARRNISALNNYYRKITEAANVPSRPERMGTYYGKASGGLKDTEGTMNSNIARAGRVEANGLFVNNSEILFINAKNVKPINGYEDFTCHSDADNFYIDMKGKGNADDYFKLSPQEYAEAIRNSMSYKGGNVRILSCQAGAKADGAAQKLANALGVDVYAPTEIVNIDENGEIFLSDNEILSEIWYNAIDRTKVKETGKWVVFHPGKE